MKMEQGEAPSIGWSRASSVSFSFWSFLSTLFFLISVPHSHFFRALNSVPFQRPGTAPFCRSAFVILALHVPYVFYSCAFSALAEFTRKPGANAILFLENEAIKGGRKNSPVALRLLTWRDVLWDLRQRLGMHPLLLEAPKEDCKVAFFCL